MATLSRGQTFGATESITNTKLHNLVDLGSISALVNADCSASMALADTKLADITTGGKVSGAALILLGNTPSGAGSIPSKNILLAGDLILSSRTSAPTGWTDVSTTYDNKFMRIGDDTPLTTTGGSDTDSITLTTTELPAHTHATGTFAVANESAHTHVQGDSQYNRTGATVRNMLYQGDNMSDTPTVTGAGSAHTHSFTGALANTGSGTAFSVDTVPAYIQVRMFKKD